MAPLTLAYYCSGHGYGHATRVSAFATHLRTLPTSPVVHIVSSAPRHVFEQAISSGALYRCADIDPVIVQPLAYHVDRKKSVDVLKHFLDQAERKVNEEASWLRENGVNCVLSDAAFLPCKAANMALIPSVLVTNFSFDSVYSYLSINLPSSSGLSQLSPVTSHGPEVESSLILEDVPIPPDSLTPLVEQLFDGYRCAELLLLLPGNIPMPSFFLEPSLPSYKWTDTSTNTFHAHVMDTLDTDPSTRPLHPSIPFDSESVRKRLPRSVVQAPLIVRHPSSDIYTPAGRKRVLDYIGVPAYLQSTDTKILIVSFGGQFFRKPTSRANSRSESPHGSKHNSPPVSPGSVVRTISSESSSSSASSGTSSSAASTGTAGSASYWPRCEDNARHGTSGLDSRKNSDEFVHVANPIATPSHLWIPGAPPANKMKPPFFLEESQVSLSPLSPYNMEAPGSPAPRIDINGQEVQPAFTESAEVDSDTEDEEEESMLESKLLPDNSWIAIVCGASPSTERDDETPQNFFIAPKDVYMPDLTAVADVLLGKLGYGTVSECVDSCTPFVYVPRPLFVEEHGLRHLLKSTGVGVELSREKYEDGDWADAVNAAWTAGRAAKENKRKLGDDGSRRREAESMAQYLVDWVQKWYDNDN